MVPTVSQPPVQTAMPCCAAASMVLSESEGCRPRERISKCGSFLCIMLVVFRAEKGFAYSKLMGSHRSLVEWPKR